MGNLPPQGFVECDAACERKKKLDRLRGDYDRALRDETRDNAEVRSTRKQYLTFDLGEKGYYDSESNTLNSIANRNNEKLQQRFNDIMKEIEEEKKVVNDNEIALKNMRELLEKYRKSNLKISDNLDKHQDILDTSRRKVWYTNKRLEKVDFYEKFITIIVKFLLVVVIIFFLYDKKYGSLALVISLYLLIMHFW